MVHAQLVQALCLLYVDIKKSNMKLSLAIKQTMHRAGRLGARRGRGPCWTRASASTSAATSSERAGRESVPSGRSALLTILNKNLLLLFDLV